MYYFFFYLGFTARQDYFTHFEPSQSLGGAKMGDDQTGTVTLLGRGKEVNRFW